MMRWLKHAYLCVKRLYLFSAHAAKCSCSGTQSSKYLIIKQAFDHVFQCVPNVVVVWHRNHFSLS